MNVSVSSTPYASANTCTLASAEAKGRSADQVASGQMLTDDSLCDVPLRTGDDSGNE